MTAAHRTWHLARAFASATASVTVRINDRGRGFAADIDLSPAAARAIGLSQTGRQHDRRHFSGAPNTVTVANIDEQLPLSVTPSVMQDAVRKRDSLLLHDQKADFDTQEQKPDFTTRDAKLEDSLQEHFPASIPKRTSHVSHVTPTPKFHPTRSQPTQFWRLWKAFLLGRR
jgi:rare lipoprotein A (peptidoglycan hydrolase)